jgi:hypothetical protein
MMLGLLLLQMLSAVITIPETMACLAGGFAYTHKSSGKKECIHCPSGKFSLKGFLRCSMCPAGRYGLGGSTDQNCEGPCKIGRYGLAGAKGPECAGKCNAGRYASTPGLSSPRCSGGCRAGTFGLNDNVIPKTAECTGKCQPGVCVCLGGGEMRLLSFHVCCSFLGKWSRSGQGMCTACDWGKYQKHAGQVSCALCTTGLFIRSAFATKCSRCPAGYTSSLGSTSCFETYDQTTLQAAHRKHEKVEASLAQAIGQKAVTPAPTVGATAPSRVCPAIKLQGLAPGMPGAETMGTYVFMGITEEGRPVYVD